MSNEIIGPPPQSEQAQEEIFCVEENTRLSESRLWALLEEYYSNASISAWNQIPFYPTSNPFIADTYADIILAFLRDYESELNFDQPIYILEMAAGSGCFSFYLLKELQKRRSYFDKFARLDIRYIMADFTEDNPKSWRQSPKLKPFVDEKLLHFGVFRPQDDLSVICAADPETGETGKVLLDKESCSNPLIVIANYFFDSIKQDAFQVQDGKLTEARHSFYCKRDPEAPDAVAFERLTKTESYHDVPRDFYDDERMNAVLRSYCRDFENASVLFPIGAFNCISNLLEISNDKLLLISSDKGFADKSYVKGRREQPFIAHHGIFSYSVNFDAIRRYFENLGGCSLNTSDDNLSVSTAVNILLRGSQCKLEESRFNFDDKVDRQNLPNYLYFLQDLLTQIDPGKVAPENKNETLRACMGYIQLCNYDPIVFCLAAPRIYFALETLNSIQERRMLLLLERVRENFFSVQQQYDVYYWAGRIYYGMNRLDDALKSL
ncbi:MAG: hypothetical protein K2X81_16490, partial [Candidatus Obscuribacterales bacterium]|nr:hypothetical protein [Candidatus Obscuribacterales bacterium]